MSRQKTGIVTLFPAENDGRHYDDCQSEEGEPNIDTSLKTQWLIKSLLSQIKTFSHLLTDPQYGPASIGCCRPTF